jgi:hypothetical protein
LRKMILRLIRAFDVGDIVNAYLNICSDGHCILVPREQLNAGRPNRSKGSFFRRISYIQ